MTIKSVHINNSTLLKVALLLVLILFLVIVYAHGNAKDVPMKKINQALRSKTAITKMHRCNKRELMQFMSIDASQYEDFLYYKSKNALGVAEVLVLKTTPQNKALLNSAEDAAEDRVNSQIHTFENYGPHQVSMLKNATIIKKGQYLFYCTAENPDRYEEVFRHVI